MRIVLRLDAEQADVARVGLHRFAQAVRIELVTARRDDDEAVPADRHRAQCLGHIHPYDVDARSEAFARGELGTVVDHGHVVLEL